MHVQRKLPDKPYILGKCGQKQFFCFFELYQQRVVCVGARSHRLTGRAISPVARILRAPESPRKVARGRKANAGKKERARCL